MKIFLEAKGIAFEERDIVADPEARRQMTEEHDSSETPTMVIFFGTTAGESAGETEEVIIGFDPVRLDQYLDSDSVTES